MKLESKKFLFPVVAVKKNSNKLDRFVGCCFLFDNEETIVTCKHIIKEIKEDEYAVIKDLEDNKFCKLEKIKVHPKFDFATAHVIIKNKKPPKTTITELYPGGDIAAFGFNFYEKIGDNINIEFRCLKGNIVLFQGTEHKYDKRSPSVVETSFASLEGFSGGPLFTPNFEYLVGMMYGNRETQIVGHSFINIDDNGNNYKEVHNRIVELGLAHSINDFS